MSNLDMKEGKREFLELLSAYGVVDAEVHPLEVAYVFVKTSLTPAQTRDIRELAYEWWNVPRVVVTVRSTTTFRAVRQPTPVEIKFRSIR